MANTLLFDDALIDHKPEGEVSVRSLEPQEWESDPARVASVYELLCAAHYRTSPLDLRRMMDAPGQHFAVADAGADIAGALWLVDEGGLSPNSAGRCGRALVVHEGTLWRSRWRRTAERLLRRR